MRWLLALIAGLLLPFAFSPFDFWPLAFLAVGILYLLVRNLLPRPAAWLGWVFALPYFTIGVHWVYNSLHDFGAAAPPVAILMTVLFVFVMTLFPAAACALHSKIMGNSVVNGSGNGPGTGLGNGPSDGHNDGLAKNASHGALSATIFASCWALTELLRGSLFGGFPWLLVGYSQTDSVFSGFAPFIGVYGVSWMLVFMAALLASLVLSFFNRRRYREQQRLAKLKAGQSQSEQAQSDHKADRISSERRSTAYQALLCALVAVSAVALFRVSFSTPKDHTLRFRMVQGNIPQEMKFSRERLITSLDKYASLTEQNVDGVDIAIWPETAIPTVFANVDEAMLPFVQRMEEKNVEVLSGGFHHEGEGDDAKTYNSFRQLGGEKALYSKRHLVPFGEFMPFRFLLDFVSRFVIIPMSDLSKGRGPAQLMEIHGEQLGISICYEDVFGEEMAESFPGATILVNISNDAWFGQLPAPQQHQQIARMRAIEFERSLLRVTNTGISSAIDHKGRVMGSIAQSTEGILDIDITPRTGSTPYARLKNWPVFVFSVLICLLTGFTLSRRVGMQ